MTKFSTLIGAAMRRYAFVASCFTASLLAGQQAQAQNLSWVSSFNGTGNQSEAYATTFDANGGVYTIGYYSGTLDFDPGAGVFYVTATGLQDAFMSKVDKNGNFKWAKHFGGSGRTLGIYTVADSFGYIYVTGAFSGTTDFNPGGSGGSVSSLGDYDIFLVKIDTAGNFKWVKSMGSATHYESGRELSSDASGNVYLGGIFTGTVDFDPGAGIYNLSTVPAASGSAFIEKLDSAGNFMWAKQVGTGVATSVASHSGVYLSSMEFDPAGNIYLGGSFSDTIDFDPGAGTFYLRSPMYYNPLSAAYVTKLDPSGNFVWVKMIAGSTAYYSSCGVEALAADVNGNVYLSGTFRDTIDIDPGAGSVIVTNPPSVPGQNYFYVKLNSSGNYVWGHQSNSSFASRVESIVIDPLGYIYNSGEYQGNVDVDPGAGTFMLTGVGTAGSYFVTKLDTNGNFIAAIQNQGTGSVTMGNNLAIDKKKNIYFAGQYNGTTDFDPGAGATSLSSIYPGFSYVVKLNQTRFSTHSAVACGSYTVGSTTHTSGGSFVDTTISSIGSDSVVTLTLTVNPLPAAGTITGTDSVCIGSTVTLAGSVTGGAWSVTNPHATVAAGVVAGVSAGYDTVKYTITDGTTGCSASTTLVVKVKSCSSVGVGSTYAANGDMQVMPNPSSGRFVVNLQSAANEDVHMVVTNIMGAKVMELNTATNKENEMQLNVAPGVYFLTATTQSGRYTQKIVVE